MLPSPGPARMISAITAGSSAPARYEIPSAFRLMPGPDDAVMARRPVVAAPNTMLIAASSLSAWTMRRPAAGNFFAASCRISLAGVIGYPKKLSQPA